MWLRNAVNRAMAGLAPHLPDALVRSIASPYIAGDTLADAIKAGKLLIDQGARIAINFLGEAGDDSDHAMATVHEYLRVIDEVAALHADAYVSIKPSQLALRPAGEGLNICTDHFLYLARYAAQSNLFLRIEMEDSAYTDATIKLWRRVHAEYARVGLVIQARLHRSQADVARLLPEAPAVRLCKGIYLEPSQVASTRDADIRAGYLRLAGQLMQGSGHLAFATHDDWLIERLLQEVQRHGLSSQRYEFQLLLGVRPHLLDALLQRRQPVRLYLPYGPWLQARAYAQRRMRQNPNLAYQIVTNYLRYRGART